MESLALSPFVILPITVLAMLLLVCFVAGSEQPKDVQTLPLPVCSIIYIGFFYSSAFLI